MNTKQRVSRTQLFVGIALVIIVAELFANVLDVGSNDSDDNGSFGAFLGIAAFGIAVTALLLYVVVPRIGGDSRRTVALVFGVLSVVTVLVFWSALPFAFGAAAIAAAAPGEGAAPAGRAGASSLALALAALGIVAGFVACIIG
jgi:hypothetical protein